MVDELSRDWKNTDPGKDSLDFESGQSAGGHRKGPALVRTVLLAGLCAFSLMGCSNGKEPSSTEPVSEEVSVSSAQKESKDADGDKEASGTYEEMKDGVVQTLQSLSLLTDKQLEILIESGQDPSEVAIAARWKEVRESLGKFVRIEEQEVSEDDETVTIISKAVYDAVGDAAEVTVTSVFNKANDTTYMEWENKTSEEDLGTDDLTEAEKG